VPAAFVGASFDGGHGAKIASLPALVLTRRVYLAGNRIKNI